MAKKNKATASIPTGFRKVETTLAGFWKPDGEGECLQGIVGTAIEVKGRDDKLNHFFPIKLTSTDGGPVVNSKDEPVKLEIGMQVGVGGKMLYTFLSERVGREVFLVYRGLGKAKTGQSAPKMFDTYENGLEQD